MIEAGVKAGIDSYRSNLRSAVRGLWRGVLTREQFLDAMASAINRRLAQAWAEGAKDCGIKPADYTEAEQMALEEMIQEQIGYLAGFADAIQVGGQASGGRLDALFTRAELWINRYSEAKNKGRAAACGDRKAKWELNPAKENCPSCAKLNGRVKRLSYWNEKGVLPRRPNASYLECRGFKCGCDLIITDEPISKGALPNLP